MRRGLVFALCAAFLALGIHGAYSYVNNYVVYRGFPPPTDPNGVHPAAWSGSFYSQRSAARTPT